jgi:hypothetical protein
MIIYSFKRNGTTEYTLHRSTADHPIAIRYPRGGVVLPDWQTKNFGNYEKLKSVVHIA